MTHTDTQTHKPTALGAVELRRYVKFAIFRTFERHNQREKEQEKRVRGGGRKCEGVEKEKGKGVWNCR